MNKATTVDLADLTLILEGFNKGKEKMSESDLIDLTARLKPGFKAIEEILDFTKDKVKVKLNHKEGTRNGTLFKAVLTLVKVDRLDQKALKDEEPDTHAAYVRTDTDERVTFVVR